MIPVWHRALRGLHDHPLVAGTRLFGLAGAVVLRRPGAEASTTRTMKLGGLGRSAFEAGVEHGVLVRPIGDSLVMAPPLIITEPEIGELVRRLRAALDAVLASPA
jgi:4-aminobutyrate--pyruvate transaminase